jgi:hypothetical protein
VFEKRVLRGIFGYRRDEVTKDSKNCMLRSFIVCTLPQILLGQLNQGGDVECIKW